MSDKPTLHEIAAMPLPASIEAMRKHYNPDWGRPMPEAGEGKSFFRVRAEWTISGRMDEVIEAADEKEAKELAREYVTDDAMSGDVRIEFRSVDEQPC